MDGTGGWWRSDDCVKTYAECSAHCVAAAVKESGGMTSRLATALCQAGDIELERLGIAFEGSRDIVNRCYVGLRGSGVRLSEAGKHIEANGLADAVHDDPHGTGMRMHVYAEVATELAQRAEQAFRHQRGDTSLARALIVASILLIGLRSCTGMADDTCLG